MTCIYCLYSTGDGRPRYIGQTTKTAPVRHAQHLRDARRKSSSPLHRWIRRVAAKGFQVRIHVLQSEVRPGDLNLFERYWIEQFRSLVNTGRGRAVIKTDTVVGSALVALLRRQVQAGGPAMLGAPSPQSV